MAVTSVSTLRPGRDPPTRPPRHTSWLTRLSSPRRTMSVAGTISPASATRFGSSKITSAPSIARDTELTESASWFGNNSDVEHRYFPKHGGTFRGCAGSVQLFNRWIEAQCLNGPLGSMPGGARDRSLPPPRGPGHRPGQLHPPGGGGGADTTEGSMLPPIERNADTPSPIPPTPYLIERTEVTVLPDPAPLAGGTIVGVSVATPSRASPQ